MTATRRTAVRVRPDTRIRLDRLRARGQTHDDVVRGLIAEVSASVLDSRWNHILSREAFIALDAI